MIVQEPTAQTLLGIEGKKSDREALIVCNIVAGWDLSFGPQLSCHLTTPIYLDILVAFDDCEWVHEAR